MPISYRSKILLAKIETTYGVDPVPTGAANAMLVQDVKISPMEGKDLDRELDLAWLGNSATIPADLHAKLSFRVELAASGTAGTAPAWAPLMRACACAMTVSAGVSVTFNPISTAHESVTLYLYIGDTCYKLLGARGTAKLKVEAQGLPSIEFEFTGLFVVAAESARPTPTLTSFQKPILVSKETTPVLTLGGIGLVAKSVSFDLGNKVEPRLLIGANSILITEVEEAIEARVEAVPLTTLNPYQMAANQTTSALVLQHGSAAGSKITLNVPAALMQRPGGVEQSQMIAEWPLKLSPLPVAGNDQFTLVLS